MYIRRTFVHLTLQEDMQKATTLDPTVPEERTQENSTFRPLTAGGIRQSIFVLVQTSLGGGQLTRKLQSTLRVSLVSCFFCGFWRFFYFDIFESVLYFC